MPAIHEAPARIDVFAIRRANLRNVLAKHAHGKQATLAEAVQQPQNLISRYLGTKNIGERTARRVEAVYGLEPGSMDQLWPAPPHQLTLGQRVRTLRLAHNATLHQLASAADLSAGAISDIEQGRQAGTTKLHRLAAALNTTAEFLETGVDACTPARPAEFAWKQIEAPLATAAAPPIAPIDATSFAAVILSWLRASPDGRTLIEQMAAYLANAEGKSR
jgi:transcriptional regulator with XRE-family HTH domain